MTGSFRYKAFISYSHADEKWARWLHRALESYKPPRYLVGRRTEMGEVPAKMSPIFRDREELASSTDLGSDLRGALESSACQIVICSMAAAGSHWVNEEILAFKRLGHSDRIFSLIVDGEPFASAYEDTAQYECFPAALRQKMGDNGELTEEQAEPIAADARPGKDGRNHAKIKLLAGMLGVGFDDLRRRELQRRNRRLAIIAGASVTGMVAAIALATTAVIARNEAELQRSRAEQEAETARRTANFMIDLFQVSDPDEARGKSITAREILVKGADRIETELAGEPAIQASLMNTMGRVFTGLGLYADAQQLLEQSLERRRRLKATAPTEMNESLHNLANVLVIRADYEAAETLYLEALDRLRAEDRPQGSAVADNLAGLAELYFQTGQYEEAEPILREVLQLRTALLPPEDPAIAEAMEELGLNMFDQGRLEEAEGLVRDALGRRRTFLGTEPHPDISENLSNLGLVQLTRGIHEETEELYRAALAMDRALYGDVHPHIAVDLNNLAELYSNEGEFEQADSMYREALAIQRETLGESHPEVGRTWNNLAYVHYYAGDMPGALEAMRRSIAILQQAHGEEHPNIARAQSTLGRWLAEEGDTVKAESILRTALNQQERLLEANDPYAALTRMALADLLVRGSRAAEALPLALAARQALEQSVGEQHWFTEMAISVQGAALGGIGRDDEAEPLLEASYLHLTADESAVEVAVEQALMRLVQFYESRDNTTKAGEYLAIYQRDFGE
jgi:tetratricopeptide (TPR) repeat protein